MERGIIIVKGSQDRNLSMLMELENAAFRLGVEVRYDDLYDDEASISSGLCYVHHEPVLIIDKKLDPHGKCTILAKELKSMDINSIYIKPVVRELIESMDS